MHAVTMIVSLTQIDGMAINSQLNSTFLLGRIWSWAWSN